MSNKKWIVEDATGWEEDDDFMIVTYINVNNITAQYNGKEYSAQFCGEDMKYHVNLADPEKYSRIAAQLEESHHVKYPPIDNGVMLKIIKDQLQEIRKIYTYYDTLTSFDFDRIRRCRDIIKQYKVERANCRSIAENIQDEEEYKQIDEVDNKHIREILSTKKIVGCTLLDYLDEINNSRH